MHRSARQASGTRIVLAARNARQPRAKASVLLTTLFAVSLLTTACGQPIDKAAAILAEGNNGLYTNEWLLGDVKTNEIAMFELGTQKTKLWRSSKEEWFGNTPGFYWGNNNAKDLTVRT